MEFLQIAYTANDFYVGYDINRNLKFIQARGNVNNKQTSFINPDYEVFKFISKINDCDVDEFLFSLYHGILTQETGEKVVLISDRAKFKTLASPIYTLRDRIQRRVKLDSLLQKMWDNFKKDKLTDNLFACMYDSLYSIADNIDITVFNSKIS